MASAEKPASGWQGLACQPRSSDHATDRGWLANPCHHRFLLGVLIALLTPTIARAADDAEGVAFFERKIRPVLVKECFSCHSAEAKKLKGGLRLDSRSAVLAGGDSGPAVVPGKPEESPLLDALKGDGLSMPPKGKLPEGVVADFEHWIKAGAPDPRDVAPVASPKAEGLDVEAGRKFWAYQPPKDHQPPKVADAGWPLGDVDRFVLAALEAKGIRPVREADRATLARRVWFDLVGLPPTPEEIDAFVDDPAPDAYEKLVDRLLASADFGERWGRHWLDVARYGESLTLRGLIFKDAWRYRDYVIDAFNADRPFDRFVREQVAGDLLPAANLDEKRRQLVATSFLVLGNTNLEEQDKGQLVMDVVDEQLDTIGKAFLGQTIGCARCHDHKFDPIPTKDYYALAGILRNTKTLEHANVSRWLEHPLPCPPDVEETLKAHESVVAALEAKIKAEKGRRAASGKVAGGVIAPGDVPGVVVDDAKARQVGFWKASTYSGSYIGPGYIHDDNAAKGDKTLTFQPDLPEAGLYEVWLAYSSGGSRSDSVPVTILSADGETMIRVDMKKTPPIAGRFVSLGRHRFEKNGQGYVLVANEGTSGHVTADAVAFLPVDSGGKVASFGKDAAKDDDGLRKLEAELKRLKASGPTREMALAVEELPKVEETRVHVRGSVHNLGDVVPRGFLRVASSGTVPPMPSHESGRRELADWLASRGNPLTARVLVNRAWHWLFGAGLVRTVDNFGTTGEPPSHPELLDHLAAQFMDDGWSVKRLVRRIVTSRAYRLAAVDDPKARAIDPEDRLLWRANRRRLDAECLRDAMLSVAGRLDPARGGPTFPGELPADYGFKSESLRRSVYLPAFRNAMPELIEAFDGADPSLVVGRRNVSTVAPQALVMMNHPFVIARARDAVGRLEGTPGMDDAARVDRAYRLALGRSPTEGERRAALGFLADRGNLALLFQALFATADFRYVD